MSARVISICNQKGGVGKTALTTALADLLSASADVLVVDVDPQANATRILGVDVGPDQLTVSDLLAAERPRDLSTAVTAAIAPAAPSWPRVDVLPAERGLAGRESGSTLGRESRLRDLLNSLPSGYGYILIDCPPSLGMLTINALVASHEALVVTEPRTSSVGAVAEMVQTIASVRAHYNPRLSLAGIAVNRWSEHRLDRRAHWDFLATEYGPWLLEPPIPEREVVASAATKGMPIPRNPAGEEIMAAIAAVAQAGGLT